MAAPPRRRGFPVAVWNRTPDRAQPFARLGARVAASPEDAAAERRRRHQHGRRRCGVARGVAAALDGALGAIRPGALLIESQHDLAAVGRRARPARTRRTAATFLDAPVTGSRTQAASGELLFLVGGDAAVVDRARPVLAAMGSRDVVHRRTDRQRRAAEAHQQLRLRRAGRGARGSGRAHGARRPRSRDGAAGAAGRRARQPARERRRHAHGVARLRRELHARR